MLSIIFTVLLVISMVFPLLFSQCFLYYFHGAFFTIFAGFSLSFSWRFFYYFRGVFCVTFVVFSLFFFDISAFSMIFYHNFYINKDFIEEN